MLTWWFTTCVRCKLLNQPNLNLLAAINPPFNQLNSYHIQSSINQNSNSTQFLFDPIISQSKIQILQVMHGCPNKKAWSWTLLFSIKEVQGEGFKIIKTKTRARTENRRRGAAGIARTTPRDGAWHVAHASTRAARRSTQLSMWVTISKGNTSSYHLFLILFISF